MDGRRRERDHRGESTVGSEFGASRAADLGARDRVGRGFDDLGEVGFGESDVAAEAYERDLASLDLLAEPFVAHAESLRGLLRGHQAAACTTRVDHVARALSVRNVARTGGGVRAVAGHRVTHLSTSRGSLTVAERVWSRMAVRTCQARPGASMPSTRRASVSPAAVAKRCAAASPGTLTASMASWRTTAGRAMTVSVPGSRRRVAAT